MRSGAWASLTFVFHRRDGRVVDCGGLENRCTARYRGFESLSLRNTPSSEEAGRINVPKQCALFGSAEPAHSTAGDDAVAPIAPRFRKGVEGPQAAPRPLQVCRDGKGGIRGFENSLVRGIPENGVRVMGPFRGVEQLLRLGRIQRGKLDERMTLVVQDPQDRSVAQHALPVKEENGMGCMRGRCHGWQVRLCRGVLRSPIFARPEKCQSGRMGLTRNQVCPSGYRGFESLLLRPSPSRCARAFFMPFRNPCTKYTYC